MQTYNIHIKTSLKRDQFHSVICLVTFMHTVPFLTVCFLLVEESHCHGCSGLNNAWKILNNYTNMMIIILNLETKE